MPIRNKISAGELQGKRIALVLMGGGAKCAFQVGVWKTLWERGVRSFHSISGTSAGALNAILIASGPPELAEKTWHNVIVKGVLERPMDQRLRIVILLVGYLLLFAPLEIGGVLLGGLLGCFYAQVSTPPLYLYVACLALFLLGAVVVLQAKVLFEFSLNRRVIPLFFMNSRRYRSSGIALMFLAVMLSVGTFLLRGGPKEHLSGIWFWVGILMVPCFLLIFSIGLALLKMAFHFTSIYTRPELIVAIQNLLEKRCFPNCTGPLFACVATAAPYVDPFDVQPNSPPMRYSGLEGKYIPLPWWQATPKVDWVPRYFDIKNEEDATWLLSASSAIPFVFQSIEHEKAYYIDGGVVDNCPIVPVLNEQPDVVIIVGVNHESTLPSTDKLQADLESLWRRNFFSIPENRAEIDKIRTEWLEGMSDIERDLLKFFSGPIDRLLGWDSQVDIKTPTLCPDISKMSLVFIHPSRHVSWPLPGLDQYTGTMKFDRRYIQWLEELGKNDAKACIIDDAI